MMENDPRGVRPELEPDDVARRNARELDRQIEMESRSASGALMAVAAAALVIMGLGLYFWPRSDTNTTVTENAPRVERQSTPPATPPASKPTQEPATQAQK